ncbi:F-box protein At1g60400-like [Papaver somniferum]|uniref:F-box protein At1g60400-like n=1 Tax=Papaver somniferum TaxID=3469 RepID=UPI000E6F4F91|nr:F-box protein At1g60400-like [Papaver somniferum]
MGVIAGTDRISELPESLTHHILSFLPIKRAASTTILSKRWNNRWLSLPVLEFTEWRSPPTATTTLEDRKEEEEEADSDTDGSEQEYRVIEDSPPVDLSETNRFMHFLDKFVEKVSHVKRLMVSHTYFYPKILDDSSVLPRSFHMFRNLVSFEVDIMYYGQIKSLFDTIPQFSPNLTLPVFLQLFAYDKVGEDALSLNIVPRCLLLCLKSIEIRSFYGHPGEIEVVKLFLENARVLHLITLGSSSHRLVYMNKKKPTAEEIEDANHKILEQLLPFSWASADCMVTFSSP